MDCLRNKSNECKYKEKDRRIKRQFINGINNENMVTIIMWKLTAAKKTSEITREQLLAWASKMKVQMKEKALMEVTKDNKEFDNIKRHEQKNIMFHREKSTWSETPINCSDCVNTHVPRNYHHLPRDACNRISWNILRKWADTRAGRPQK